MLSHWRSWPSPARGTKIPRHLCTRRAHSTSPEGSTTTARCRTRSQRMRCWRFMRRTVRRDWPSPPLEPMPPCARDWWGLCHAALWEANAAEIWSGEAFAQMLAVRNGLMRSHGAPHPYIAWIAANEAMAWLTPAIGRRARHDCAKRQPRIQGHSSTLRHDSSRRVSRPGRGDRTRQSSTWTVPMSSSARPSSSRSPWNPSARRCGSAAATRSARTRRSSERWPPMACPDDVRVAASPRCPGHRRPGVSGPGRRRGRPGTARRAGVVRRVSSAHHPGSRQHCSAVGGAGRCAGGGVRRGGRTRHG